MTAAKPASRPQWPRERVAAMLGDLAKSGGAVLLGVRGYYLDSLGKPGVNDRGVYDDAIFLVSPNVFAAFNANTDPSAYRAGIATLKPGTWLYRVGVHGLNKPADQRYEALVQAAEVVVTRDGKGEDRGWFGINIHRGGVAGTSSLGCQTIVPEQWGGFMAAVKAEMAACRQKSIAYMLIENTPEMNARK